MNTLPPSFNTQAFGELTLSESGTCYHPSGEKEDYLRFEPGHNVNPPAWIELIDSRLPLLERKWAQMIDCDQRIVKAALDQCDVPSLGENPSLKRILLTGDDLATLHVQASPGSGGPTIEMVVNSKDEIESAKPLP